MVALASHSPWRTDGGSRLNKTGPYHCSGSAWSGGSSQWHWPATGGSLWSLRAHPQRGYSLRHLGIKQNNTHLLYLPKNQTRVLQLCVCFRMGKKIRPPERASSRRSFFILCWEFNGSACCSGFSLVIIPRLESFRCPPESQCGENKFQTLKLI